LNDQDQKQARAIIRNIFLYNSTSAYTDAMGKRRGLFQARSSEALRLGMIISFSIFGAFTIVLYFVRILHLDVVYSLLALAIAVLVAAMFLASAYYVSSKNYRRYKDQSSGWNPNVKRLVTDSLVKKITIREYGWKFLYINSLVAFGDERKIDCLIDVCGHEDTRARDFAIEQLKSLNAQAAIPRLKELLNDGNSSIRLEAESSLNVLENREGSNAMGAGSGASGNGYSIYPYNSFAAAKSLIEQYGVPDEVVVQEGMAGRLLDTVLTFGNGTKFVSGGFSVGEDGPRSDFLRQLLVFSGFDVSASAIMNMRIPACFAHTHQAVATSGHEEPEPIWRSSRMSENRCSYELAGDSEVCAHGIYANEYSIYPFNSCRDGERLIDQYGGPKGIQIVKSPSNGFLDVALLFDDGHQALLGGFEAEGDGPRVNFLAQLLDYAGVDASGEAFDKLTVPAHFIRCAKDPENTAADGSLATGED
jgi:hypothetical protein